MVTSSSTLAGYGAVGAGLPPHSIEDIVVVTKAYSSAVGAGEFISEILDEDEGAGASYSQRRQGRVRRNNRQTEKSRLV